MTSKTENSRVPGLLMSLVPILFLMITVIINIVLYGDGSTGGPNQMALFAINRWQRKNRCHGT